MLGALHALENAKRRAPDARPASLHPGRTAAGALPTPPHPRRRRPLACCTARLVNTANHTMLVIGHLKAVSRAWAWGLAAFNSRPLFDLRSGMFKPAGAPKRGCGARTAGSKVVAKKQGMVVELSSNTPAPPRPQQGPHARGPRRPRMRRTAQRAAAGAHGPSAPGCRALPLTLPLTPVASEQAERQWTPFYR